MTTRIEEPAAFEANAPWKPRGHAGRCSAGRVLLVARPNSSWGGAQKYLMAVTSALVPAGFSVDVALDTSRNVKDFAKWFADAQARVHDLPLFSGTATAVFRATLRLVRRERFDIVHFNGFPERMGAAILAAQVAGAKRRVLTLHLPVCDDAAHHEPPRLFGWRWRRRRWGRFCFSALTDVICINGQLETEAIRSLGQSPTKVHRIYNGIDACSYRLTPRRRAGEIVTIGAAGLLNDQKRHDVLIDAVALLAPRHPIRVLIAGAGPLESQLRGKIAELGLSDVVQLVGYQRRIQDFLEELDIFAMSSDDEGVPFALLEAMASGLPSVSTGVGGIPEMVDRGKEGLLVERRNPRALADALAKLIVDADARETMGTNARRKVEAQFSSSAMLEKTVEVFQRAGHA